MNMAKMIDKEVTVTAKTATVTDRIMVTVATMATAAMVMADTPALEMAATALPITTQLASVTMATMAMDTISPLMVVAQRRLISPYLTSNKATTRRATTQRATTQRATTTHTATTLKATAAPKATTPRAMAHRATTHMAMTTKAMAPKAMTLKATMTISKVVTTDTMIRGMVRRMLMPLKPQTSRAQQAHPQTNKTTPKLLRKPTLQETTIPSSTSLPQTRTSMVLMTCMLLNRTTQPKASSATRRTWIKSTWALLTKWNHIPSQIQHLRLPTTETKRRMKSE